MDRVAPPPARPVPGADRRTGGPAGQDVALPLWGGVVTGRGELGRSQRAHPGQRGLRAGALAGQRADVAYLGVGQLRILDEGYIRRYWAETVEAVGARRVVLIHWDDFFSSLDRLLRALPTPATIST